MGGKNRPPTGTNPRILIIVNYLSVDGRYIKINLLRQVPNIPLCDNCNSSLKDIYPNDDGNYQCPSCRIETPHLHNSGFCNNDSLVNTRQNNYADRLTFLKATIRYKGEQQAVFIEDFEQKLDIYFDVNNCLPSGAEIRKLQLTGKIKGRKQRGPQTNRTIMYEALSEINPDNYGDINLICHNYWGWELPNIPSHIEDILINHYDRSQIIYEQLKGDRRSSLGADYRLFRQLWHIGFPCHPNDFKIVTTDSIISYYEDVWEKICFQIGDELGWKKFISIHVLVLYDYKTLDPPRSFITK